MERLNSEGIRQDELLYALKTRRTVQTARRIDSCLLCRRHYVNEAGLCDICYAQLEGEEAKLAERWLSGIGP
ncbi:hypothetical protein EON81_02405 [bacterium]|nr:MAG: hypothetical protein EON81_02405 [bacterium]